MTDLTMNVAGQGAREMANMHLAKMRENGRFLTFLARLFNINTEERSWRIGAEGEEYIGGMLNKLKDKGYYVLHSVEIGSKGSDVDHIVIGPTGVFTINSKNHPNKNIWVGGRTVMVNGQKVPYIRNSEFEAHRVGLILSKKMPMPIFASGFIVFTSGRTRPKMTVKENPVSKKAVVEVADASSILKKITSKPVLYTKEDVEELYTIARESTVWITKK